MKKRLIPLFFVILLVVLLTASPAVAQAPQMFDRPTADELFARCGECIVPQAMVANATANAKSQTLRAAGGTTRPIALLRSSGFLISSMTSKITLDVIGGYDHPVFIAGRVFSSDDNGRMSQFGHAFYAAKALSFTAWGPGYFPALYAGGVIPVGEIPVGNAGEQTIVEVVIFDSDDGGRPIQTLRTSFWSRVKLVATPVRVTINSATVAEDGETVRLIGFFPTREKLIVEIGDPEWDSGFVDAVSYDGVILIFRLPAGKSGGRLYPRLWPAEIAWGITVLCENGESFSFSALIRAAGNSQNAGVAFIR